MQFLNKYKKKYGRQFGFAVIFVTLEAWCDLLQPTIMSKIIDTGVAGRQLDYIINMGGLMLSVTALGALAATMRNIISSRVSQRLGAELRADLYRKIQALSFSGVDRLDRASLVTRLTNDVTQVQTLANGMMRISLKAPLLCIGGLIMAVSLNRELSVVLAAVIPVVAVIIIINMKMGFPLFVKVQTALDRVNGVIREYLAGIRVVKAFNRFDYEQDKFSLANEELRSKSYRAIRIMAVFSPGITLTLNLGIIAVLWLGGLRVYNGQMQVGHIIAFINYMTQILFSLMIISMVFNMFVRAQASAARIGEVFSQDEGMHWPAPPLQAAQQKSISGRVDFEHVYFAYEGQCGEPVLKNVSFTCMPGDVVGIIGTTGAGKSSLVNLIPRFYDCVSGTVKVDGEDVRHFNPGVLRTAIAVVPQKTILFTGSIADNIRWGKDDATPLEIEQAAQMAEAHDFIMSFPEGYQTWLGQGGVNLSGGQKQRIAIARALIRKPGILILDDCTSAVDVETEGRIKEAIRKYAGKSTCLIIAQRITSIRDADKILVLDNGQITAAGTHAELMTVCPVYREIFQSQMGKELK